VLVYTYSNTKGNDMTLTSAVEQLIEDIKANYAGWGRPSDVKQEMINEFNDNITYTVGKKYAKIITRGSVWGFVVAVDNDKTFAKGDVLKPASWASPARNFRRGNVLEGKYNANWTGA